MNEEQATKMMAYINKSMKEIEEIFLLEDKSLDDSAKVFGFFFATITAAVLATSDIPLSKVNDAHKEIMANLTSAMNAIDMEEMVKMFR